MDSQLITSLILIIALGIGSQWLAWRLKLPAIILLMVAGLSAGPMLGWLQPSKNLGNLLEPLIAIAVAVILFEGGLNLRWHEYRETHVDVKRMVSIGLLLTWFLGSVSAHYVAGLSWPVALVLGAIIVVTGPTVVMPLLKQAKLRRRPAALLKWEGIINDPIGALLAVLVFEYFVSGHSQGFTVNVLLTLTLVLVFTTLLGGISGYALAWAFRKGYVPEHLKSPVMLAATLILYSLCNQFQEEAGLMAVTVAGVVLANQHLRSIDELRRFKEYITIILVSMVFIILAADMELERLQQLDTGSIAWLLLVVFLIRPVVIYLSTLGTGIDTRERLLIAWIAPRGIVAAAVAGLFAPRLINSGYSDADQLLPLVFSLITITVILHGLSISWLARRLQLAAGDEDGLLIVGASPRSIELAKVLQDSGIPTLVSDADWNHLRSARLSGIRSHHGQILSEQAEQNLELNEISHVLAATANDAYNALVCTHFSPEMGRTQTFQLPCHQDDDTTNDLASTMRGRIALPERFDYDTLIRNHYAGWIFQCTTLSSEFTYEDYQQQRNNEEVIVAILDSNKSLLLGEDINLERLDPGEIIISYHLPRN